MAKNSALQPKPALKLSQRQAKILAAIVKLNCDTGQPVASHDLVEKYDFGLSSATSWSHQQGLRQPPLTAKTA